MNGAGERGWREPCKNIDHLVIVVSEWMNGD